MKRTPLKRKKGVRKKSAKMPAKSRLDALCREVILNRDGHRCTAEGAGGVACKGRLEWSHIYTRTYLSTRWLPENSVTMCTAHHFWWHKQPLEGANWFNERFPGWRERIRAVFLLGTRPDFRDVEAELKEMLAAY